MSVQTPAAVRGAHLSRTARPEAPRRELPAAVALICVLVVVINTTVLFWGGQATGVSWDEPVQVQRLQNYFDTQWFLPDSQMQGGTPKPDVEGLYVYGPAAALIAHGTAVLLGAEDVGRTAVTAEAYEARHVGIGLIALLGLAAAAGLGRMLLGSWRWGLLCAALLSSIPLWIGHGMFNVKDLPAAAGYLLATTGLVAIGRTGRGRTGTLGACALAAGIVLAVGTRPGLWAAIAASAAAMLLLLRLGLRARPDSPGWAALMRPVQQTLVGAAAGYGVLVLVYPAVFAHPDRLLAAVRSSSEYPWVYAIRTAGIDMPMPPPPAYLPLWFGAQTPLVVLLLASVALVAAAVLLVRQVRGTSDARSAVLTTGLVLVAIQALLLPTAAIVLRSVLYDAQRQVLSVVPALAVLAAAGAWLLARRVRGWARPVLWTVVVAGMVASTVGQIRLFPFGYTWFNAAAEVRSIDGNWMTDYWRTSSREAVTLLPSTGPESCVPWSPEGRLWPCASLPPITPYWEGRGSAAPQVELGLGEYWFTSYNRGSVIPPRGCTIVDDVTRPLLTQRITMSYVARCQAPIEEYPSDGIEPGAGTTGNLLWGWYPPAADGAWSGLAPADVGMVLPPQMQGRGLTLEIELARYVPAGETRTTVVSVNGAAVSTVVLTDRSVRTVRVDVPRSVAEAWQGDRLLVRFESPDPVVPAEVDDDGGDRRALGTRLVSLRVVGA